jgi:hypothetical protein
MQASAATFLLYTPEIESIRANEQEVSAQIADTMRRISTAVGDQFRHTMRPVHAKSHGLLRAKLTIQGDLPEHYRQGLSPSRELSMQSYACPLLPVTSCQTAFPLLAPGRSK